MKVKALFDCVSETRTGATGARQARQFKLQAVSPQAGTPDATDPEVNTFWEATPSGTIELWITNPDAFLEIGTRYEITFEPRG